MDALTVKDLREAVRVLGSPLTPERREREQKRLELWLKVVNGEACYWYPPIEFLVNGGNTFTHD